MADKVESENESDVNTTVDNICRPIDIGNEKRKEIGNVTDDDDDSFWNECEKTFEYRTPGESCYNNKLIIVTSVSDNDCIKVCERKSYIIVDELNSTEEVVADNKIGNNTAIELKDEVPLITIDSLVNKEDSFKGSGDVLKTVNCKEVCKLNGYVSDSDKEPTASHVAAEASANNEFKDEIDDDANDCGGAFMHTLPMGEDSFVDEKLSGKLVTSTPYGSSKRDCGNGSTMYVTPARSVLEKWKPSCLSSHQEKLNCSSQTVISEDILDISNIENSGHDLIKKNNNCLSVNTNGNDDEFEEAFKNLYTTLFGFSVDEEGHMANMDSEGRPINNNNNNNISKLELYRDNIVEQHKRDDEKFNEIISEISSISGHSFVTFNKTEVDGKHVENELSVIAEEEFESSTNENTVVEDTTVNRISIRSVVSNDSVGEIKSPDEKDGNELKTDKTIENKTINESDDEEDKKEREMLELPVISGANSIIYLNSRELTLDEENALLNDSDDAVSLFCSDIDDITQKTKMLQDVPVEKKPVVSEVPSADIPTIKTDEVAIDKKPDATECIVPKIEPEVKKEPQVSSEVKFDRDAPFVSSDPQENEDNNSPQWEHLRRLSTDKERYKALRERWRSVIIPDPNLDLTSQTFRKRKAANIKIKTEPTAEESGSNKVDKALGRKRCRSPSDSQDVSGQPDKKKRKCTTLFEQNISDLLKKLEYKRYSIFQEMNTELNRLAIKQEHEAYMLQFSRGCHNTNVTQLFKYQTEEVRKLRQLYVQKVDKAERETGEYITAMKAATEEIFTFHKFYQDLDSANNNGCSMYLSDKQFQELIETEHMLELYSQFYG